MSNVSTGDIFTIYTTSSEIKFISKINYCMIWHFVMGLCPKIPVSFLSFFLSFPNAIGNFSIRILLVRYISITLLTKWLMHVQIWLNKYSKNSSQCVVCIVLFLSKADSFIFIFIYFALSVIRSAFVYTCFSTP